MKRTVVLEMDREEAFLVILALTDYQLQSLKLLRANPSAPVRQKVEGEVTRCGQLITRTEFLRTYKAKL